MSNLTERLTSLKGRLNDLPVRFGLPKYRDVVIRIKSVITNSEGLKVNQVTDILINPVPRVKNINPKLVEMMYTENVEVGLNDLTMAVVRTFDLPDLEDIEFVVVDPVFDSSDRLIDGIKAKIVHISDNKTTDYKTILRRMKDTQKIVLAEPVIRS